MFHEHESVQLVRDLAESGLVTGAHGAIVHVHGTGEAYEVEFFTDAGETIAVETVQAADLRRRDRSEQLSAAVEAGEYTVAGPVEWGPAAGPMTVGELIAQLQQLDLGAPVLTSGYEGGLAPAHVSLLEVQKLDRHGEKEWLGDWETLAEAREQAAEPDGPSAWNPIEGYRAPSLVGEPVTAAVIYRAGR